MDRIVGQLFRRYAVAGVLITGGVVAGVVIAQRQHIAEFPAHVGEPAPCAEACAKRASCGVEAEGAATRCTVMCQARAAADRVAAAAEARCALERPCAELASCGGAW